MVLLLFVVPVAAGNLLQAGYMPRWLVGSLRSLDLFQTWIMRGLIVVWVFFFGACFASFLNVVAWRVPRGRGINGSSYCPHCNVRLRMSDNMPIVGWLRNSGRCRDCKSPITIRYLIVELSLGLVTLGLVALTVFWGGFNLPGTGTGHQFDIVKNLVAEPRSDLIQIVCFHLVLVYSLFTVTVVRTEKLAVPGSIVGAFAVIGVGLATLMAHSYALDWCGQAMPSMNVGGSWLATIGLGAATGLVAGLIMDRLSAFGYEYKSVGEVDMAVEVIAIDADEVDAGECGPSDSGSIGQEFEASDAKSDANSGFSSSGDVSQVDQGDERGLGSSKLDSEGPVGVLTIPDGVATMTLVGLFLGWQAVTVVVAMLVCWVPVRRLCHCFFCRSLASQVFLVTLVMLASWRFIAMALPF